MVFNLEQQSDDVVTITATVKEFLNLYQMVEDYRHMEEEKYNFPPDKTTLFTSTQLEIFRSFDSAFEAVMGIDDAALTPL